MSLFERAGRKFEETKQSFLGDDEPADEPAAVCPACEESVPADADHCPHCGEELADDADD